MEKGYIGIMEATALVGKSREHTRDLCKQKLVKSFKDDNGHWNIEKKSKTKITACISIQGFKMLAPIAKKSFCTGKVKRSRPSVCPDEVNDDVYGYSFR